MDATHVLLVVIVAREVLREIRFGVEGLGADAAPVGVVVVGVDVLHQSAALSELPLATHQITVESMHQLEVRFGVPQAVHEL